MLKQLKFQPSFFEGFLLGCLAVILFLAHTYGWTFDLIKTGNYIGPSYIYGIQTIYAAIYVLIVFVLYEFVVERSAIQAGLYTVFGYFYLDSIVQIYYTSLFHPNDILGNMFLLIFNPDYVCIYLLIQIFMIYHLLKHQYINQLLSFLGIKLPDYSFHFIWKRFVICFIILAPIWYFVFMPLRTPASICLPTCVYILSSKRLDKYMRKNNQLSVKNG